MKNLAIALVAIAACLSIASHLAPSARAQGLIARPAIQVVNPLGIPGWVPVDVWMARQGYNPVTGAYDLQDHTVPAEHFALVRTMSDASGTGSVYVDTGGGFIRIASEGGDGNFEPGFVVEEGAVIRAGATTAPNPCTVHGYLIPNQP